MKFVTGDKNQRIIKGQEEITFSSLTSYHLIILTARAKGEKQISESSTDDEDDADRMPTLEKIIFNFGSKLSLPKHIPTVDNPEWTGDFYDDTELMLLARAVYGEVGGESKEAKIAVAWTIRTRVEDEKNRWGKTYHDVILADFQYEPFNNPKGDPFKKITQPLLGDPLEKQAWQESYKVAEFVFFGKESDPTKGANHFYVPSDQPKQDWVDEKKFTVQIGATRFYKL